MLIIFTMIGTGLSTLAGGAVYLLVLLRHP